MHISDAKHKLEEMREKYKKLKDSKEPSEREFSSYLSVEIDSYEKAIKEFEQKNVDAN